MKLLPVPQSIEFQDGGFDPSNCTEIALAPDLDVALLQPVFELANLIEKRTTSSVSIAKTNTPPPGATVLQLASEMEAQAYTLEINAGGARICAGGLSGLCYGMQTLLQIAAQASPLWPCVRIEDAPDYPVRGLYFDIARGKIPTFDELCRMVDRLARYKMNQFQLYIEHTFAFRNHSDIWAGADPITADEILRLDLYCQARHIDLIPALSTFGHFTTPLKSHRKKHLNERDIDPSENPFSWWERITGYTLDVSSEESFALVKELIEELAPLFSSKIFNICCDETWDLGQGKNKERAEKEGVVSLYLEFVGKISSVVFSSGKMPMLWGDVILHHPERIADLPKEVIVLNYLVAGVKEASSPKFKNANIPFYNCVQLSTQNRFLPELDTTPLNILKLAAEGKENGAIGFLANEWGDSGHINPHVISLYGIILCASVSWNTESFSPETIEEYDQTFSRLELGDPTGTLVALLREFGRQHIITWHQTFFWIDPFIPADWREATTQIADTLVGVPDTQAVFDAWQASQPLYKQLAALVAQLRSNDEQAGLELLFGARGVLLLLEISLLAKRAANRPVPENNITFYGTADAIRRFERDFSALWHQRNRPSEFYRIKLALTQIANLLDRFGLQEQKEKQ